MNLHAEKALALVLLLTMPAHAEHPLASPDEFRAEVASLALIGLVAGLVAYGVVKGAVLYRGPGWREMPRAYALLLYFGMLAAAGALGAGLAETWLPPDHGLPGTLAGVLGAMAGHPLWEGAHALLRALPAMLTRGRS